MLDPISEIIDNEGGYVDDPTDRGGATKYGITQKTLESYLGKKVTKEDVKNLTKKQAREIYERRYLSTPRIDSLDDLFLRTLVLDMAVNFGPRMGIKILQRAINKTKLHKISVDGVLGPNTRKCSNNCFRLMAYYFSNVVCDERQKVYNRIVLVRPSQKKFIDGWTNRTNSFREELPNVPLAD